MSHAFLLCRPCGLLHPVLASSDEADREDLAAFRTRHGRHRLEHVDGIPGSALFDGPAWNPMSDRWLRVTAGSDTLVVRSWRPALCEPRRHELVAAAPRVTDCVEIDEPLIRHALERHFHPHVLQAATRELIVETTRALVATLDPGDVVTSFDDPSCANASIGPLPHATADALLNRCATRLDPWTLDRLRRFISEHRLEDGALAVRVRRVLSRTAA